MKRQQWNGEDVRAQVRNRGDELHRPNIIFIEAKLTNELSVLDTYFIETREKLYHVLLQSKDAVVPAYSAARNRSGRKGASETHTAHLHGMLDVRKLQRRRHHFGSLVHIHSQALVNLGAVQSGKEVLSILQYRIHRHLRWIRNQVHVGRRLASALVLEKHRLRGLVEEQFEALLGPDDAVHGLIWGAANGTDRIHLLGRLGVTLVARRLALDDGNHLSQISSGAGVNERSVGSQTEAINVSSGVYVVQRIENQIELLEICQVELGVLDVLVVANNGQIGVETLRSIACNDSFGLTNVLWAEQELTIQIGNVDRIQVDQLDVLETSQR